MKLNNPRKKKNEGQTKKKQEYLDTCTCMSTFKVNNINCEKKVGYQCCRVADCNTCIN